MTDFGRGEGDMLKSAYDTDHDGVVDDSESTADHASKHQKDGDDEISVTNLAGELADAQKCTWTKLTGKPTTFTPAAHKTSHQSGESDPINVTGLTGTTPRALLGDATAGRVLRQASLKIEDGTNANTIKCTLTDYFNGDTIAATDNIAKDATTGDYTLSSGGNVLRVEASGLSGNVLLAYGAMGANEWALNKAAKCRAVENDIRITFSTDGSTSALDITAITAGYDLLVELLYLTDA